MLPDLPTATEAGFRDFELEVWFGIYAPADTPRPMVQRLSEAIRQVTADPVFRRRSEGSGTTPAYMDPAELLTLE
jgi:tripartite-type tricarboxylate transporter receptor subunit TctC